MCRALAAPLRRVSVRFMWGYLPLDRSVLETHRLSLSVPYAACGFWECSSTASDSCYADSDLLRSEVTL